MSDFLNTISFKKEEKNFSFDNEIQAQIDQNSIQKQNHMFRPKK